MNKEVVLITKHFNAHACMQRTISCSWRHEGQQIWELPTPNMTSAAGRKLPNTRIPNHSPQLRTAISLQLAGIASYVSYKTREGKPHSASHFLQKLWLCGHYSNDDVIVPLKTGKLILGNSRFMAAGSDKSTQIDIKDEAIAVI